MSQDELAQRYERVKDRVAAAAERSGRTADSVFLVAVTKYAEPEDIRALIEMGHRDFGESRVPQLAQRAAVVNEWFDRIRMLPQTVGEHERQAASADLGLGNGSAAVDIDKPVRWHMIGHLQRNKARKVAEFCRLIHSVDSLRLAEELQQIAGKLGRPLDCLVQVNCSGEEQKYGCAVPAAEPLVNQIDSMIDLNVRGMMAMAPHSENPEDSRTTFRRCRELYEDIQHTGVGDGRFNLLSMGMSGDFEVAIEEGANIVRVGSAIFGERVLDDAEVQTVG